MPAEIHFRAMGTSAHVAVLDGPPGAEHVAASRIAELEQRWSRFLPDSELSQLNQAPHDRAWRVSPDTFRLVAAAVAAWEQTGGRYDPTVLDAIVGQGYDRTFESLPEHRAGGDGPVRPAPGCAGIRLDERRHTVTLPAGVGLDPGGIGKGLAADLVAEEVMARGAQGVLVDLGGDIRVAGLGPHDDRWVIDIEHPVDPDRILLHLALRDVGIATSSRLRRRWHLDHVARHHLIDPATGAPTTTDIVAATVIASDAARAEALTKVLFVTGDIDVVSDASALVVTGDGNVVATADLIGLLV